MLCMQKCVISFSNASHIRWQFQGLRNFSIAQIESCCHRDFYACKCNTVADEVKKEAIRKL